MKCKVKKVLITDFDNLAECVNNAKPLNSARIYRLNGKYRLIHKTEHLNNKVSLKNTYFEYFKTLEYGILIRDF